MGELAVVLDSSGIGELPLLASPTMRCCGMEDGGDGGEVPLAACSGRRGFGGVEDGWLCRGTGELESCTDGDCGRNEESACNGGDSLRFLWEDVVMVKALLPGGNKARASCRGMGVTAEQQTSTL